MPLVRRKPEAKGVSIPGIYPPGPYRGVVAEHFHRDGAAWGNETKAKRRGISVVLVLRWIEAGPIDRQCPDPRIELEGVRG